MNGGAILMMMSVGARRVGYERVSLLGQLVVYWVLIVSYGTLFQGIDPARLAHYGLNAAQLTWYMVVTQSVIACTYFHYREMEIEIRTGGVETMLLRPVAFWPLKLAEWFGQYLTRLCIALPFGFLIAWFVTGGVAPDYLRLILLAFPAVAIGGLIFLCMHLIVGSTAIWVDPTESVYRMSQKTLFFLGARSTPLLLYPAWIAGLSWATPFPAVFAVPASFAMDGSGDAVRLIAFQLFWLAAALFLTAKMAGRVRKAVGAAE
jgi:ABC-type uncharacterized transport system permease subunit